MGEFAAKYHIENVAFWAILGTIFTWIGLTIVLYSEIKAVIITRERDERQRLIDGGYLSKVDAKMGEREYLSHSTLAVCAAVLVLVYSYTFMYPMCVFCFVHCVGHTRTERCIFGELHASQIFLLTAASSSSMVMV